jgi:hypothetical protein
MNLDQCSVFSFLHEDINTNLSTSEIFTELVSYKMEFFSFYHTIEERNLKYDLLHPFNSIILVIKELKEITLEDCMIHYDLEVFVSLVLYLLLLFLLLYRLPKHHTVLLIYFFIIIDSMEFCH